MSNNPFHESTDAALVQHFCASTGLTPIGALGINNRTSVRFTSVPDLLFPPGVSDVVALYWVRFETAAKLVIETAYRIVDDYGVQAGGPWRRFAAGQGGRVIEIAAERAKVQILAGPQVEAHARRVVAEVHANFEEQRRRGLLRSVNSNYRAQREGGANLPSYGAYVLSLKRQAIAGQAARLAPSWFQASASASP